MENRPPIQAWETREQSPGDLPGKANAHWRATGMAVGFACVCISWVGLTGWLEGSGKLLEWFGSGAGRFMPEAGLAVIGAASVYAFVFRCQRRIERLTAQVHEAEAMHLTSQKMEAFGALSAGIAHDFSNTLTVIRGMTDLARIESYDPRVSRSAMEAIQLAAFRGEEIARQLVDFLAKPKDQFALRDLNVVTRDFSPILRQAAGPRTILAYELEDGLPATLLSRTLVEQALLNLVINSRDAVMLSDPPRITIATKTVELIDQQMLLAPALVSGSFIELSVSDNGCGIPDKDLARVFSTFYTTKEKGSGLGLPSVLRVIQHHEGYVDVRSGEGDGTRVRLLIPIRSGAQSSGVEQAAPLASGAS